MICKFKITSPVLITKKDSYTIDPRNIKSMMVIKKYESHFLPITKVTVIMPTSTYDDLIDSDEPKLSFGLAMVKEQNEIRKIKGTFSILVDDLMKTDKRVNKEDNNSDMVEVILPIFKEGHLNTYRKHINRVLSSATPLQMMGVSICERGFSNVIMTPPHNTASYSDYIVTPGTFLKDVEMIQNRYGIYNNGYILFQDWDYLYILDKKDLQPIPTITQVKTLVLEGDSTSNNNIGSEIETPMLKTQITWDETNIRNLNKKNKEIYGDGIIVSNVNEGGVEKNTFDVKGSSSGKNFKFYESYINNSIAAKAIGKGLEQNNVAITLQYQCVDFTLMTPEKTWIMEFQDLDFQSKFGGEYRLAEQQTLLERDVDDMFVPYTQCMIKQK